MSSLVLGRREGESFELADGEIVVKVMSIRGGHVRLRITAPEDIPIVRSEIVGTPKKGEDACRTATPAVNV